MAAVALVVAVVAVTGGFDDDADGDGEPATAGANDGATEGAPDGDGAPADEDELTALLTTAGESLTDAGTFSFEATGSYEGPDPAGIDETFVFDQEMSGDVDLPGAVRQRIHDGHGTAYEYVTIGSDVSVRTWLRDSAYPDQLDERPWSEIDGSSGELDISRLPEWLGAAVDPEDEGTDRDGDRVVSAGVPAQLVDLGPDVTIIDVALEATLADDGVPVRVELVVSSTDTIVEATYDIVDVGNDVEVSAPSPAELDPTPWFNEQDMEQFDGPAALGLSHVPTGWELLGAYVTPDPEGGPCPSITVDYTNLSDPVGQFLWIDVMEPGCIDAPLGEPLDVAGFTGAVTEEDDGTLWGVVSSADTAVMFSTDLSVDDLRVVLGHLGPLDLVATPQQLDGIPSD